MKHFARLAALGAATALTVALSGCAEEQVQEPVTPAAPAPAPAPLPPVNVPQGLTQDAGIYGPACDQLPTSGEGSAEGIADDPIGTAASNIPPLSTLAQAVQAAGLTDTLNDPNASYTVFAPANPAFDALPAGTLDQLLANPQQLTDILTYHVVPQRYDAQALSDAGTVTTVQGSELTITGDPGSLTIDQQEQASVLCGNIPTANGTVFVIDKVLMP